MMMRLIFSVVAFLAASAATAQQFDIDMRGTDQLTTQGRSAPTTPQVTRSSPSLGAGPQLDMSGGLADTFSSGGSTSCTTCQYGGTNQAVDNLRNTDSLR